MKIICDWENCNETGVYKAPVEKDNSKKYRLLCLNHIKIFIIILWALTLESELKYIDLIFKCRWSFPGEKNL